MRYLRRNSAWNYKSVPLKWSSCRKRVFVNDVYEDFVNDLGSSVNIQALDVLIRLQYIYDSL